MTDETTTEQLADTSGRDIVRGLVLQVADLIEREEAEIEGQGDTIQVREGRWKTRGGDIRNVTPTPAHDSRAKRWPWRDAKYDQTWTPNGRCQFNWQESPSDLVEYLGPIEPESEQVNDWPSVRDLRHELKTVQTQLGESRQRVTELEELVASLRTINETQEKAFTAAGKENTALRNQLTAVKAELASVAADRQQLRVELDAAQQVPAAIADRFKEGWNQGTARAVETIVEWLVPIRTCGSQALATAVVSNLPHIMRSLTGLEDEEIERGASWVL